MIRKPLPPAPTDSTERAAFFSGATLAEWNEWRSTGVLTVSMRVKWWWRKHTRTLR